MARMLKRGLLARMSEHSIGAKICSHSLARMSKRNFGAKADEHSSGASTHRRASLVLRRGRGAHRR
eukprot:4436891-Pleurochrysis_carterae.AAC.2